MPIIPCLENSISPKTQEAQTSTLQPSTSPSNSQLLLPGSSGLCNTPVGRSAQGTSAASSSSSSNTSASNFYTPVLDASNSSPSSEDSTPVIPVVDLDLDVSPPGNTSQTPISRPFQDKRSTSGRGRARCRGRGIQQENQPRKSSRPSNPPQRYSPSNN